MSGESPFPASTSAVISRRKLNFAAVGLFIVHNFTWCLVLAVFVLLGAFKVSFFRPATLAYMLYVSSLTGFLIYAQSLCLISGNFDLSIERIAGISPLIGALLLTSWLPGFPGIIAVIFVILFGGLLGFINGFLVGKVGVNSFMVTLSTYIVYLYLAYFLLAAPIGGDQLPRVYMWLGAAQLGAINVSTIAFVGVGLLLHLILRRTPAGVHIYATGADPVVSRALGINTSNVVLYTYTLSGLLSGVAGLAYVGFTGSVTNSIASGEVFWSFAGAIIGGVSLRGGRGSMLNVIGGSIFIGLVTTGVLVFHINETLRMVIAGIIILFSILTSRGAELLEERLIRTALRNEDS